MRNQSARILWSTNGFAALLLGVGCVAAGPDPGAPGSPGGGSGAASSSGSGSGTPAQPGPSDVKLLLTDAPAAYDNVWVTTSRVDLSTIAADGTETWSTLTDQPETVDLLTLQNDVTSLLGDALLTPATYDQLRLIVDHASVVVDGVEQPLTIPSGTQTGVKIDFGLTTEADTTYTITLDFDAARSIHQTGAGELIMIPALSIKSVDAAPSDDGGGDGTADAGTDPAPDPTAPDAGVL